MAFNVTYSFNDGAVTGTATDYVTLYNAIHASDYTQIELSGTIEGNIGSIYDEQTDDAIQYGLFYNCEKLIKVNFIGPDYTTLDTSGVTSMKEMFYNCYSLEDLTLGYLDVSNVTDMSGMFEYCESLTVLEIFSDFDTSNVTNMSKMFYDCSSLATPYLWSFDTNNVTDMSGMFSNCSYLKTLDLSDFDTSSVTDMSSMFEYCDNLTFIKVGENWDVSNVLDSENMFNDCYLLLNYDEDYTDKTKAYVGNDGYLLYEYPTSISVQMTKLIDGYQYNAFPKVAVDGTTIVDNNGIISATAQTPSIATTTTAGIVKPDGNTINVSADGTISASSSANVEAIKESEFTQTYKNNMQSGSIAIVVKNI